VHLTERFKGKNVYLVGTLNQSTMLAQRTQKLIQSVKPDNVLVMANPDWWDSARTLRYVDSQEEFTTYGKDLDKYDIAKWMHYYKATRKYLFLGRLLSYYGLFQSHFRFGSDFNFFRPGLEVKYACEAAQQTGAKLTFLGSELNSPTW
jgi:pheromone shutdown protein TraB